MATRRTRTWATVVYPESCVDKWQDVLAGECVPAIISPLHDKDINPDGTPKKPHWHVMFLFAGPKSQQQVSELCNKIGGVLPIPIQDSKSMARYFIHKDNPSKYQYEEKDIVCLSGADYYDMTLTSKDRYDILAEIITYLKENKVLYYSDLLDFCLDSDNLRWLKVALDNTVVLRGYCVSASTKKKDSEDVRQFNSVPTRSTQHYT